MNMYDSQRIEDLLRPHGYVLTDDPTQAYLIILNTCHIREKAEHKVYSDLGRFRQIQLERRNGGNESFIAVGGCVAQAEGAEILTQAPYVSMVFGPQSYHYLPQMWVELETAKSPTKKRLVNTLFPVEEKFDYLPMPQATSASAFITIQEGCDKFCHFCCVPYTRGAEYSRTPQKVLDEIRHLADQGVVEITLLGQNVNGYHGQGPNGKEWSLGRLIYEIADTLPEIKHIRYTTSHPRDMHQELIDAHGSVPALLPFLHLPVQSGSDQILQSMNRKHTVEFYKKIIDDLRHVREDMVFSSDFIVGYPGEQDEDHRQTLELMNYVVYGQVYSFKYSKRPGTPAAIMNGQVSDAIQNQRLQELQDLANSHQLSTNQGFVGRTIDVLLDRKGRHPGQLLGRSSYMQSVHLTAPEELFNKIVKVKIMGASGNSLAGELA